MVSFADFSSGMAEIANNLFKEPRHIAPHRKGSMFGYII